MTKQKAYMLTKIIRAAWERQENKKDAVTYVMQSLAQEINIAINPTTELLAPFIIAELELAAKAMRSKYPAEASEAADEIKQAISSVCIKTRIDDIVTPPGEKKS